MSISVGDPATKITGYHIVPVGKFERGGNLPMRTVPHETPSGERCNGGKL